MICVSELLINILHVSAFNIVRHDESIQNNHEAVLGIGDIRVARGGHHTLCIIGDLYKAAGMISSGKGAHQLKLSSVPGLKDSMESPVKSWLKSPAQRT